MYTRFDLLYAGSFEADCHMPIPQLRRIWTKDGSLSNHILVSIVRLIVETNLATSKDFRGLDVVMPYPLSATVSIVSLVMIVRFPVSGSMRRVQPSV